MNSNDIKKGSVLVEKIYKAELVIGNCKHLINMLTTADGLEVKDVLLNGLLLSTNTGLYVDYVKRQLEKNKQDLKKLEKEFDDLKVGGL